MLQEVAILQFIFYTGSKGKDKERSCELHGWQIQEAKESKVGDL